MARAMRRINHTSIRFLSLSSVVLAALWFSACGDEDAKTEDATTYSLDFSAGDADPDTTGWKFENDTSPDTTAAETDTKATEYDATDGGDPQDGGGSTGGDATTSDTGPAPITTCAGSCGIKLESNACHCDHACVGRGDCCADFTAACACESLSDCDDMNPCTTDTCKSVAGDKQWCLQVPFFGCCNSDAACGPAGKNKCVTPMCLQGSCTDVKKDCDDGVPCTLDVCDPLTGTCTHKLSSAKCLIDGACHGAGASQPGSGGCVLCQPDKAQDAWTPKAGTCLIDGICSKSGEKASPGLDECRVCDPSKSTDAWSVTTGKCYIDKTCHVSGAKSTANPDCATCQPTKSQLAWSGVAGKCAVGSKCYEAGKGDAALACAVCDPSKSASSLTPKPGTCIIDNACVMSGASKPGAFGCQTCNPAKSLSAWTQLKAGTSCSDDDPCSIDTLCTVAGLCKGKTQPNCCSSDADCIGKVNPGPCEKVFCKGDGVCASKPDPDCCAAGKCCDLTTGKLKPAGTPCSTFVVGTEYKCEGSTIHSRKLYPGCTGKPGEANKCSQSQPGTGPWVAGKTCGSGTTCTVASKTTPPLCK